MENIIEVKNLSKNFISIKALKNVSYLIQKGFIYGLVGENGAGKSTLIKILSGIYQEHEGEIYIGGEKVNIKSPLHARELGISTIFQELTLIPKLSIVENIFLGRESFKYKTFLDRSIMRRKSKELLDSLELKIDPLILVENLSIAKQQIVEICKALSIDSKVLIMDEPTASLTREEINDLFTLVKKLKERGKSIIFVTHKINEIFEICDYVTVIRDGIVVCTEETKNITHDEVVKQMIGHKVTNIKHIETQKNAEILLSIRNFSRIKEFKNIDLNLHAGEIIGLAGLIGAGRTELVRSIMGFTKPAQGSLEVLGKKLKFFRQSREAINMGLVYLPEDRKNEGIFPKMGVGANISLIVLRLMSKFSFILRKKEKILVDSLIKQINIKTTGEDQLVENLSGGNQQKVIISRLLATNAKIYFFDEATRGVDIGSKFEIYEIMKDIAKKGNGIIFISSEIPELLLVCDNIILMKDGKFIKNFKIDENPTEENIMDILTGKRDENFDRTDFN
jgi:ribose transport system ATP-binding protein